MPSFVLSVSCLSLLVFVTFDGLGSAVGHVFEHLGCDLGGVLTVSSMPWGGLNVAIRVH